MTSVRARERLLAIVLARRAEPGRVKTRLCAGAAEAEDGARGAVEPAAAAEIATALLRCVILRLERHFDVALATTPEGAGPEILAQAGLATARAGEGRVALLEQGDGDLGARLGYVWDQVIARRPVAFFGIDSPDVPDSALVEIESALAKADVAAGPTADGGYWTLAARARDPWLLSGIDWGGPSVYDQTRQRAREAGLAFHELPMWDDVDRPEDLRRLRERLSGGRTRGGGSQADAALDELSRRLEAILTGLAAGRGS